MKCIECRHENPNNPRYCTRCGQPMTTGDGATGQVRKTQADAGLFDPPPAPVSPWTPVPAPSSSAAAAAPAGSAQPRRTVLEEGGPAPAPNSNGMSPPAMPGQRPSMPIQTASQGGRTVLDEGPALPAGHYAPVSAPVAAPSPGTARAVGWMVSYDRNPAGQDYVLRAGRNRLGRSRDNEISLFFEPKASDNHATIIWRNGQAAVKDEASTNGTLVNGVDIGIGQVQALRSGDTVTIGGSTFVVFLVDAEQARAIWPTSPWAT